MIKSIPTKQCCRCKKVKPLTDFNKKLANPIDGRTYECKDCANEFNRKQREKKKDAWAFIL